MFSHCTTSSQCPRKLRYTSIHTRPSGGKAGTWCWNSNTLGTWWEELTHWKRPWCWERLKAGGEGDDRGWDGWMASQTQRTWVWASSRSWWWTGRPGVLQSMGTQRVRHDQATELNWDGGSGEHLSLHPVGQAPQATWLVPITWGHCPTQMKNGINNICQDFCRDLHVLQKAKGFEGILEMIAH